MFIIFYPFCVSRKLSFFLIFPLYILPSFFTYFVLLIFPFVHRCGASGSMRACHAAGPASIPGRDRFPGWGFFGVFPHLSDQCQETLGPQGPLLSVGRHNHHSGMTGCVLGVDCLSCLCCLGGGPGIGLITHLGRPSMSLCGQKSIYVIHSLILSPDRSWLCKARVAWVA